MDQNEPLIPPPSPLDRALELLDRARGHPVASIAVVAVVVAVLAVAWPRLAPDRTPVEDTLAFATVPPTVAVEVDSVAVAVHAAGAVRNPGLFLLDDGSRVADLLDAAGGPTTDADLGRVNLAAPLLDGTQVYVPIVGEVAPVIGGADPDDAPIDLNTADASTLELLPGIGPALSAAVIDHRNTTGAFESVDDLLAVSGIGPAKLDRLRELVVVR